MSDNALNRSSPIQPGHIAFYIPTMAGGGAERITLTLASAFADYGYRVDLVLNNKKGPYTANIPNNIRVVELSRGPKLLSRLYVLRAYPKDWPVSCRSILFTRQPLATLSKLRAFARYLTFERPDVVISGLWYSNMVASWARALAGSSSRLIVAEHNTLSLTIKDMRCAGWSRRKAGAMSELIRRLYSRADAVVAVSDGVATDLAATTGLDRARITTIYNPVVSSMIVARATENIGHEWFYDEASPVILALGRLNTQKNFAALIDAFAETCQTHSARLVILGEGPLRAELEEQAERLGLGDKISMPGWAENPYAYMALARVVVLSSRWEGLPTVLIEAMACGCPVVATDCASGPREILDEGRYGPLVPIDDCHALALAINDMLISPVAPAVLQKRADDFSIAAGVASYRRLVEQVGKAGVRRRSASEHRL